MQIYKQTMNRTKHTRMHWLRLGNNPFFFFGFEIHTASPPITSGTHTDGGAVIRKPGSA